MQLSSRFPLRTASQRLQNIARQLSTQPSPPLLASPSHRNCPPTTAHIPSATAHQPHRGHSASSSAAAFSTSASSAPSSGSSSMAAGSSIATVGGLQIERVPCLKDNYSWLLHDPEANVTGVVDPAEEGPVVGALQAKGWALDFILNTHHHWDHVGGNLALKSRYPGCRVVGPLADEGRIPGIDVALKEGDCWAFGAHEVKVFDTPGHTRGHITLWFPKAQALFPGDTLFCLGCGRLFEGTPQQMWTSLSKLLPLPDETRVFCAHEYTESNAEFAVSIDPGNAALAERKRKVDELREKDLPTVPSTLGEERATNPFLRAGDPGLRQQLGLTRAEDWQVFAAVRKAKDNF